jgi:hypothetical protein
MKWNKGNSRETVTNLLPSEAEEEEAFSRVYRIQRVWKNIYKYIRVIFEMIHKMHPARPIFGDTDSGRVMGQPMFNKHCAIPLF